MARPNKVNFRLPGKNSKTYVVNICKNSDGEEVKNKTLKTKCEKEAALICRDLDELHKLSFHYKNDSLFRFHPTAYEIFYGHPKPSFIIPNKGAYVSGSVDINDSDDYGYVIAKLIEKLKDVEKERDALREKAEIYDAWVKTKEGEMVEALRNIPDNEEILTQYQESQATVTPKTQQMNTSTVQKMLDHLKKKPLPEISAKHIEDFLTYDSKDRSNPEKRWNRVYTRLTKFYNFLEKRWLPSNPMRQVSRKKVRTADKILNHHTIEEVEKAIEGKELYWQCIISILGFQGLSAHELRALKANSIVDMKKGKALKIEKTDDIGLKTGKRTRYVLIHQKRVWPYLKDYLKTIPEEQEYLFPPTHVSKYNHWETCQFGRYLKKHVPAGMNALSLRRSFANFMVQHNKSNNEGSAVMGNSAQVFEKHYGRLGGEDVIIDF